MKNLFTAKKIIILIVIVVISAFIVYGKSNNGQQNQEETVIARRGDLVQEVSATGRVSPVQDADLAFERSGRIANIYVKPGDRVAAGQVLIRLVDDDIQAQVAQARASLDNAERQKDQLQAAVEREQAKLAELRQGARPEDIQISQTQLNNAQQSFANAQINLETVRATGDTDLANLYGSVLTVINDAYIKGDDAIRKQASDLFTNNSGRTTYKLTFTLEDPLLWQRMESRRDTIEIQLGQWRNFIDSLNGSSTPQQMEQALDSVVNYLTLARDFLNDTIEAVNKPNSLLSSAISSYRASLNTGRTNVASALTSVNSLKQSISSQKQVNQSALVAAQIRVDDAQSAVTLAGNQLALKQSSATTEQIAVQEAQVRQAHAVLDVQNTQISQAQANVENYEAQAAKAVLRSSISGIVTKQEGKKGEIVAANATIVSVMSNAQFNIETNIPEADIAKIKIGQAARVTLDAYGSEETFNAVVISIDPGERIIEGVATYKTTLRFNKQDSRLMPGLTANVDILTDKKENVIYIPRRAVMSKEDQKIVRILNGNAIIEAKIGTGLAASDGNIEIASGVNEGDKVIIPRVK